MYQVGHRQEVCGLKWSPDNQYLASGGNDNKLFVWSGAQNTPMQTYSYHVAAVKVSLMPMTFERHSRVYKYF